MYHPCSISTRRVPFTPLLLLGALLPALVVGVPATSFAAIVSDPNCSKKVLPRNDDHWASAPLGFLLAMGGGIHADVFVNNNGYVTFGRPPPPDFVRDWRGLVENTSYNTIAAFYADVDTRHPGSDEVTYGQTTYAGHLAFCVNWGAVNGTGYYPSKADKKNKFQLILVRREDRGTYDFDIIMNYDQVQWDQSFASTSPLTVPTWVGFKDNWRVIPGSGEFPSGLLDGQSHALTAGSLGTPVPGRYIHEIHNGVSPAVAVVSGTLLESPDSKPVAGAIAQLCRADGRCTAALTDSLGHYSVRLLEAMVDGTPFTFSSNPPAGRVFLPLRDVFKVWPVVGSALDGHDAFFKAPESFPSGTQLGPLRTVDSSGVPVVHWQDSLRLATTGCIGAIATYTLHEGADSSGAVLSSGRMLFDAATKMYVANIPPLAPAHGLTTVTMRLDCPNGPDQLKSFPLYIDPSGHVRNANGNPIRGARMTLYRSDYDQGPFEVVPDGSTIMSPANRTNPMYSDERGYFGWDTLAGFYVVRAEKPGCSAVGRTNQSYTETDVLPVPPPVTDLDLRLDCSAVPPPALSVPANLAVEAQTAAGALVTYEASAMDAADGPVSVNCMPASGSPFPLGTTVVRCSAMNSYGNVATASFSVTVADTQPPVLTLPSDLALYATGAMGASVTYEASAMDALDGSVAPVCTPPSGATFPAGESRALCTATDSRGNMARGTISVHVSYEFGGLLPPLSGDSRSTFKPNQVIPVRFTLSGASAGISTLAARLFVAKVVGGEVYPEVPAVSAGAGTTDNLFRPTGSTGTYQFLLSTKSMAPGMYWLRIDLGDSVLHALPIVLSN